jgi:hypothetical protein
MAAFAALCFSFTAKAQGPVVISDKDDYAPGETALFQAAGFHPVSSWTLASRFKTRTASGSPTSPGQTSQPMPRRR